MLCTCCLPSSVDGDLFLGSVKQFYSKSNGAEDGGAKLFDWTSWGVRGSIYFLTCFHTAAELFDWTAWGGERLFLFSCMYLPVAPVV